LVSDNTLADIRRLIEYDPDDGSLRWREQRSPRVLAGDFAGSWVERDKRLVISVNGRSLPASSIAWFLAHGEWPDGPVKLETNADRDPMTIPLDDMYLAEEHLSENPAAAYMREYRRRQRAIARTSSKVKGVRWSRHQEEWECYSPRNASTIYARFRKKRDAEAYQYRLLAALAWIDRNPPRIVLPGDDQIFAVGDKPNGRQAMSLAEAKLWFANAPSGLVYREGPFPGAPAGYLVEALTTNRPQVRVHGRHYAAASIAWFIAHGEWPRRKAIVFKDGNVLNTRIDNLVHRGALDDDTEED